MRKLEDFFEGQPYGLSIPAAERDQSEGAVKTLCINGLLLVIVLSERAKSFFADKTDASVAVPQTTAGPMGLLRHEAN